MKVPETFIQKNKDLDKKLKDLKKGKSSSTKQVKDLSSLACLPRNIGSYVLRTDFEMINKKDWESHFGKQIPKCIIQAGEMTYQSPSKPFVFTSVYVLEFKNGTDLDEMNRKIDLEEEISQDKDVTTKCLKKDAYLVAITANKLDDGNLSILENWYLNNSELEAL